MGFMDLRQWMQVLEKEGELRRIGAEVDWDREIGAVARRVLEKKGPALLFENISGYRTGPCTKLLTGGLGDSRRLALALGFPKDAPNRELVQLVMKKNRETIPPVVVRTGPVKERILRGRRWTRRFPGPEVELPRGWPLHPHVLGDRHAGSRHPGDERGDLPRDDRAARTRVRCCSSRAASTGASTS